MKKQHTFCPWCEERLPVDFYKKRAKRQRERITASFKKRIAEGKSIGRPRKVDKEKIASLRAGGFSIRQIAKKLGISSHPVWYALKQMENDEI